MINPIAKFLEDRKTKQQAAAQAKAEAEAKAKILKEAQEQERRKRNAPQNYIDTVSRFIGNMGSGFYPPRRNNHRGEYDSSWTRLMDWKKAEIEYADLGYRTISLDTFRTCGGSPQRLADHLLISRGPTEEPVFHAQLFERYYLDTIECAIELRELKKQTTTKTSAICTGNPFPSTEVLNAMVTAIKVRELIKDLSPESQP